MAVRQSLRIRFVAAEEGAALGPALFALVVLGLLSASIAAGTGYFSSGESVESQRAKAAALLETGQALKAGMDRLARQGIQLENVILDESVVNGSAGLFSPEGGGVMLPSAAMAADPSKDQWIYTSRNLPDIGTATGGDRIALLRVSSGVCEQINLKAASLAMIPGAQDLGNFYASGVSSDSVLAEWPGALRGKMRGCVRNIHADSPGFFFYQVVGTR